MDNRQYVLAIKRNNNDYLPLEWHLTPFYHGENMNTLQGIDTFTKDITDVDLLVTCIAQNMLTPEEHFQYFTIIYQEKGRIRELKDGTIFKSNPLITDEELIYFILTNMQNKKLINRIYNICTTITDQNEFLERFKLALNNLASLASHNPKAPRIALSVFSQIPYNSKRSILVRFCKKILPEYATLEDIPVSHRKVPEIDEKIA